MTNILHYLKFHNICAFYKRSNFDDLIKKIDFYLNNDIERDKIVNKCYDIITSKFNLDNLFKRTCLDNNFIMSIEERVKYYTANLNKKYEFKFDESQEIVYYNKDTKECTYTDQRWPSIIHYVVYIKISHLINITKYFGI